MVIPPPQINQFLSQVIDDVNQSDGRQVTRSSTHLPNVMGYIDSIAINSILKGLGHIAGGINHREISDIRQ